MGEQDASAVRLAERNRNGWQLALGAVIILGISAIILASISDDCRAIETIGLSLCRHSSKALSFGLLLAGASLTLGCLIGFLFGIPRSGDAGAGRTGEGVGRPQYRANTNLEQISDWLTKILVGVSLTKIGNIPSFLSSMSEYLSNGFGVESKSEPLVLAVIVFFWVTGFLFGYLWTRLYFAMALADSDSQMEAVSKAQSSINAVQKQLEDRERQNILDADAFNSVLKYLRADSDTPTTAVEAMKGLIGKSSPSTQVQIFYEARRFRSENRRDDSKKPLMERSIPVFEALIAADPNGRSHQNFGQLGYALKDKKNPDWDRAEAMLSKAIQIRGDFGKNGFGLYELNRALCRIALQEAFEGRFQDRKEAQEAILEDLKVGKKVFFGIAKNDFVKSWLDRNQLIL